MTEARSACIWAGQACLHVVESPLGAVRQVQFGEDVADVIAVPDGPHNLNRSVAHLPDILTKGLPVLNPTFTYVRYAGS